MASMLLVPPMQTDINPEAEKGQEGREHDADFGQRCHTLRKPGNHAPMARAMNEAAPTDAAAFTSDRSLRSDAVNARTRPASAIALIANATASVSVCFVSLVMLHRWRLNHWEQLADHAEAILAIPVPFAGTRDQFPVARPQPPAPVVRDVSIQLDPIGKHRHAHRASFN